MNLEFDGHRTEASRGANLVGMSVLSPDVCLSPCLAKKKVFFILFFIKKIKILENIFIIKKIITLDHEE